MGGGGDGLTAEGVIAGTLKYMSPEQAEGRAVDHRSDLFALGAILYEMWTGRRAFGGGSPASVIASIMSTPPASLERRARRPLARDPEEQSCSTSDGSHFPALAQEAVVSHQHDDGVRRETGLELLEKTPDRSIDSAQL